MAINPEKQYDIKSLKASFCRQHFHNLMQFLRKFDISSVYEKGVEGEYENDFNMHFLLQAYDEEKVPNKRHKEPEEDYIKRKESAHLNFLTNQRKQKENCKWWLNDVNESDVFLAIEEYFSIVAEKESTKKLASILVNSIITEGKAKTLFSNNSKELYSFEDETTLCILQHLNIKMSGEETTLGAQRKSFAQFLLSSTNTKENPQDKSYSDELCDQRPEVRFIQAFELLASIRNWTNHEYVSFLRETFNSYCLYQYIIFTHIGLIYVCKRLWNNPEAAIFLSQNAQNRPSIFKPTPTILNVRISANKSKHTICNCRYSLDDEKSWIPVKSTSRNKRNKLDFSIKVYRYQSFKIIFECEGAPYDYVGKLNYYAWDPILEIVVKPPKSVNYSFEGIAGDDKETEEYLGNIFTKCIESYFNAKNSNNDVDKYEKALVRLGDLEPSIKELQELAGKNSTNEDARKTEIRQKIIPQLEGISKDLNEAKTILEWIKDFLLNLKYVFVGLIMAFAGFCLYKCCLNEIATNIFWLERKWLCITTALLLVYFTFRLLTNKWNLCKAVKEDGKMKYWITGVVAFIFLGSPFFLEYPDKDTLVKDYDFSHYDSADNQVVASFLENSYKKNPNDEGAIILLATYYLNYSGEDNRAYDMVKPLLDNPNVHKQSLLTIAEIYFAKGDFKEVYDIIERCKKQGRNPCINRLEGLLYITPDVNMLNYAKGDSLLKLAAQQGDTEALYWLGHLRSNFSGIWKSTYQNGKKKFNLDAMDYDLIASINYLRQAASKRHPKATLELGNIYLDLNIVDSAELYYKKVLGISDRIIKNEAYYRLGLLEERRGEITENYMQKAVDNNFEPALLHKANNSGNAGILYFKKMGGNGGYNGYRYIPPIVFRYLNEDRKDSALMTLQRAHPNDKIDSRFVDAIEATYSVDSLANDKGRKLFSSLSNQCKYAQMLTTYWELEKLSTVPIFNTQAIKEKIELLEGIGKDIPIAYALVAFVLKKMGANYFEESDKFAQRSIMAGHPGGAAVLAYFPQSYFNTIDEEINSFFKDKTCTKELLLPWNKEKVEKLAKIRSKIHLALRMSIPHWMTRTQFINYGQKIDYILFSMTKDGKVANDTNVINRGYPDEHLRFWSNVALGVNDFDNEGWMSYQYHRHANQDFSYREKIIESMLRCVFIGNDILHSKKQAEQQRNNIAFAFPYIQLLEECRWDTTMIEDNLSNYLSEMPESFKTEMKSKYGSDTMIKRILEKEQIVDNLFILGTSTINGSNHAWFDNDRSLLEDWSAADEGRISLEPRLK